MFSKIRFHFFKFFQPYMVGKYKRFDGVKLMNTRISNSTYIGSPDKFYVEDHVFIGHFNFIDSSNGLTIREGCQITNYVSILTHSSHISIRLYGKEYINHSEHVGYIKGEVEIGAYSFIGPHTVIMPGSKIGKGSIISNGSYVNGEFPDFAIISGNPAKVIGDTREIDKPFLDENKQIQGFYNEWITRFNG